MAAASMDIAPEWLDGYLAAIVVAPKIVMPSGWLGGLLEREHEFAGDDELQRFFDLLLLRYNAANDAMADADVAGGRAGASELKPLLPAWLAHCHAMRR